VFRKNSNTKFIKDCLPLWQVWAAGQRKIFQTVAADAPICQPKADKFAGCRIRTDNPTNRCSNNGRRPSPVARKSIQKLFFGLPCFVRFRTKKRYGIF
jgi:hypothetical protein